MPSWNTAAKGHTFPKCYNGPHKLQKCFLPHTNLGWQYILLWLYNKIWLSQEKKIYIYRVPSPPNGDWNPPSDQTSIACNGKALGRCGISGLTFWDIHQNLNRRQWHQNGSKNQAIAQALRPRNQLPRRETTVHECSKKHQNASRLEGFTKRREEWHGWNIVPYMQNACAAREMP